MFLTGKFHSHITLVGDKAILEKARKLVGGKVTIIELENNGKKQNDGMITHHYVTGYKGLENEEDVIKELKSKGKKLKKNGFEVLRLKLEHEPFDGKSPNICIMESCTNRVYIETHIKIKVDKMDLRGVKNIALNAGWQPSKNIYYVLPDTNGVVQFVNKRWYDLDNPNTLIDDTINLIKKIQNYATIIEVKHESAVFDTNIEHDKWWI